MQHLTTDALIRKLTSDQTMERGFAAEELGARRAREAVTPLIDALRGSAEAFITHLLALNPVLEALGAIGDPSAITPLLRTIELTASYLMLTPNLETPCEVACQALVQLGGTSAVPTLERLLGVRGAGLYGRHVARALVALGGAAQAPRLERLLESAPIELRAASAEALQRLGHRAAIPKLQQLADHSHVELRWSAQCALVGLDAPGAEAALKAELRRPSSTSAKCHLMWIFYAHQLTAQADWLDQLVDDATWSCNPTTTFDTLEFAVRLGSASARERARLLHEDASQSACARARSAGILLDQGDAQYLEPCLHFLRHAEAQTADPRDPRERYYLTYRELFDVLRRFGKRHRQHRLAIAEAFYAVIRRGPDLGSFDPARFSPASYAAQVLYVLTGATDEHSLARWSKAQAAASA